MEGGANLIIIIISDSMLYNEKYSICTVYFTEYVTVG
jgi:hypothetical protein